MLDIDMTAMEGSIITSNLRALINRKASEVTRSVRRVHTFSDVSQILMIVVRIFMHQLAKFPLI